MCWASWISLGIIVTLLVCMAQRLASSISLTKYASAASCRHKMVCPWKHRSYLPTSRAILQTNHEKGHFQIRSSVLFWYWHILQRAIVPSQYLWVFFSFPAVKYSFLGSFPPTVGGNFFWAGSSPPNIEGLALVAICANCQNGNDYGDLPVSSSCSASTTLLLISSWSRGVSCPGAGWSTGVGGLSGWLWAAALVLTCLTLSLSPFLGIILVLTMLEFRKRISQSECSMVLVSWVTWPPSWIYFLHDVIIKGFTFHMVEHLFLFFCWAFSFKTSKLCGAHRKVQMSYAWSLKLSNHEPS